MRPPLPGPHCTGLPPGKASGAQLGMDRQTGGLAQLGPPELRGESLRMRESCGVLGGGGGEGEEGRGVERRQGKTQEQG